MYIAQLTLRLLLYLPWERYHAPWSPTWFSHFSILWKINLIILIWRFLILQLERSLDLDSNPDLEKIGLPTEDEPSHTGDEAVISGFGLIHIDLRLDPLTGQKQEVNGRTDEKMRFAKVEIIDNNECARKNFYQRVVDTHICGHALQRGRKPEGICSVSGDHFWETF